MCGIALTTRGPQASTAMLNKLAHRGPDGSKVVTFGKVSVGHARLAIVDTKSTEANQPFVSDSRYVCAFNGEIFNYRDLTLSTEVVLLGQLMEAEHDLTQLLNGYYAVAFHDIARNKIVLARDLYGVMPLYYTKREGHFEAASERKALSGFIHEVPANSRVEYDLHTRQIKITRFSQPFRFGHTPPDVRTMTDAFLRAVSRTALHSDNGFSVALSGGLDSSMVLCALKHMNIRPDRIITTYTQLDDTSEYDRAVRLAAHLGWSHLFDSVPVDSIDESTLLYYIESKPNPIRDFAFKRHATVARVAPTKVILCGEGADELGLGYPLNRELLTTYDRYFKKVSLLKSQTTMTLDRVNKAGMMHSKEYRVPFLDLDFSLQSLASDQVGKNLFRRIAERLGVPDYIIDASKYSNEETVGRSAIPT